MAAQLTHFLEFGRERGRKRGCGARGRGGWNGWKGEDEKGGGVLGGRSDVSEEETEEERKTNRNDLINDSKRKESCVVHFCIQREREKKNRAL